jgi:hypothetical protein
MDHDLLVTKHRLSTVKAAKLFGVPVVHLTANVAGGQKPTLPGARLSPELGIGDVFGCPGTGEDVPREMVTERHLS